jgi:hypothetical protein
MSNKKINRGKILLVIALGIFFIFGLINFEKKKVEAAESDAIAVRVVANPKHLGPLAWYLDNGFKGNPTPLTVDGYDAVQDGRTVYVNVANVVNVSSGDTLYTNIYLISYNQNAKADTISVFTNILNKWKFNTNLTDNGVCFNQSKKCQGTNTACNADNDCTGGKLCKAEICLSDADCSGGGFCDSLKGKITRDVKRLAEVVDLKTQIVNYADPKRNGHYPLLKSGTYITGKTISTWPSWNGEFATELGKTQAIDPINKMGACPGFDATTCWDDKTKTFSGTIPGGLPADSRALVYSTDALGHNYTACALMESGLLIGDDQGACLGSNSINLPPVISCGTLLGTQNQDFTGYVSAIDPENDPLSFTFSNLPSWVKASDTADPNKKMITSLADQVKADGTYPFNVTVSDGRNSATSTCNISITSNAFVIYPVADQKALVGKKMGFSVYAASSKKNYSNMKFNFSADPTGNAPTFSCAQPLTITNDGRVRCDVAVLATTAIYNGTITITASNNGDNFTSQKFNLNVYDNPPVIQSIDCPNTIRAGQPLSSCAISATDPDGHSIASVKASSLPNNVYLASFSDDKTCELYFEKIISAVAKERYQENEVLGAITFSYDSDWNCRQLNYNASFCAFWKTRDMAAVGLTTADLGGRSFVFDENEHENSLTNCTQDAVTLDGCKETYTRMPLYSCANPVYLSFLGNRGTMQGTINEPGIYHIAFTATDQYGATSQPVDFTLKVNTFCGDKIKESPNTEGKDGPNKDGYEDCDGTSGTPSTPANSSVSWQYGCATSSCISARDGFCGDAVVQDGKYNSFTLGKEPIKLSNSEIFNIPHDKKNKDYGEKCDFGMNINCCSGCDWTTSPFESWPISGLGGNISKASSLEVPFASIPNRGVSDITFDIVSKVTPSANRPGSLKDFPLAIAVITDISNPPDNNVNTGTIAQMRKGLIGVNTSQLTEGLVNDFYNWSNDATHQENVYFGAFGFASGTVHALSCPGHFCWAVPPGDLLDSKGGSAQRQRLADNINQYDKEEDDPYNRSFLDLALPEAKRMLDSLPPVASGQVPYARYIIILSDGCTCTYDAQTASAADAAKAAGIGIYTISFAGGTMCSWSSDNGQNCFTDKYSYISGGSAASFSTIFDKIKTDIIANLPQQITITISEDSGGYLVSPVQNLKAGQGSRVIMGLPSIPSCQINGNGCDRSFYLTPNFDSTGSVIIRNISVNLLPACEKP